MSKNNNTPWVRGSDWKEFREAGMLWFVNSILHVFGWAICVDFSGDGEVKSAYPVKTRYRGFDEKSNDIGYSRMTKYMADNIEEIKSAFGEGVSK